ncbi:MAG: nucleotidyltransferase family protein [bacterium]
MKTKGINLPRNKITDFCRRRRITEFALFGSALRDDFHAHSDIDVLVTFAPDTHYSLFDLACMQDELESILGLKVDLVEKASLRNPFRRYHILKTLEILYAA